jgi:hypothetical protein
MLSLEKDLQSKKSSLNDFELLAGRVLTYLPNVLSGFERKSGYLLYYSVTAGTKKFLRPVNEKLFIMDAAVFTEKMTGFKMFCLK